MKRLSHTMQIDVGMVRTKKIGVSLSQHEGKFITTIKERVSTMGIVDDCLRPLYQQINTLWTGPGPGGGLPPIPVVLYIITYDDDRPICRNEFKAELLNIVYSDDGHSTNPETCLEFLWRVVR